MTRPRRQFTVIHGSKLSAQRLFGDADLEFLPKPLAEIDDPPTDHTVDGWDRPAFNDLCQSRPVFPVEQRWLSRCFAIDQTFRTGRVELQHPVPDDLQGHPADRCRLAPRRTVIDRCKGQQSAHLIWIITCARRKTQTQAIKIRPKRDRHRELLSSPDRNHTCLEPRKPHESHTSGPGISCSVASVPDMAAFLPFAAVLPYMIYLHAVHIDRRCAPRKRRARLQGTDAALDRSLPAVTKRFAMCADSCPG